MGDFNFKSSSPLGGYNREFSGVSLREVTGQSMISIATPLGGGGALKAALVKAYKIARPEMGTSTAVDNILLLGLQQDQIFLLCETVANPVREVGKMLGDTGYYADQSDSWAMLSISGENARQVLARICPLDLAPDAFPVGKVARTLMDHMGVIIFRDSEGSFLLLCPTSLAQSFLHALEICIKNTDGE